MTSLFPVLYRLRCRLGAWLLKEHVAALCEHYSDAAQIRHLKQQHRERERCWYIGIGLRYAIGQSQEWRRFDDRTCRMVRRAREALEHARDAL